MSCLRPLKEADKTSRTQRIIERLPNFYKSRESTSLVSRVVGAIGKRLEEAEKESVAVMRAHWVDTAAKSEIDNLGALYNMKRRHNEADSNFRVRLKRAIIEFKGGGTINAVLTSLKNVLSLPEDQLELIENPPEPLSKLLKVKTGDTWELSSESISDALPSISIGVESEDSKIINPTIVNIDINESITFEGVIQKGKQLNIEDGKATLDGIDVTEKLSTIKIPKLPTKRSNWKYSEHVEGEIAVFDVSQFNAAIFEIGIDLRSIVFKWTAYRPATFEIRIPRDVISEDQLRLAQGVLNSVKAVGIKGTIKLTGG